MAWDNSTRRSRLPKDWAARTKRILERDRHKCYRCGARATEVDHVKPGDDHRDSNLAAICQPCHRTKTAQEGVMARGDGAKRLRPKQQHPGLKPSV